MEPKSRPIPFTAEMVRAILDGRKSQTRRVIKPQPDRIKQKPYCLPDEHFVGNLNMGKCPYGQPGDRLWVRETWRVGAWDPNWGKIAVDYKADGYCRKEWLDVTDDSNGDEMFNRLWEQSCIDAIKKYGQQDEYKWCPGESPCRWRSPRYMPRWASRITLLVKAVRVERVQDISEGDAVAEGAPKTPMRLEEEATAKAWMDKHGGPDPLEKKLQELAPCIFGEPAWSRNKLDFVHLWEDINEKRDFGWDQNPWVWVVEFEVCE